MSGGQQVFIERDDIGNIESLEHQDFLIERKNDKEFCVHHGDDEIVLAVKVDRFGGLTCELIQD